ncbi:hypothetical protein ANCDUO_15607 [Ancylostoma duodenale]|uniref:Uncharacterized protein n=1 Tax=Ancylostoma duodenale TaxID=51022 RepID=A0A0C2CD42_9BILA|nr:hypothetical protein ANCDUO_15607 [Ancylostoma duodenale]
MDTFPEFWDLYCAAIHNNTGVPLALKFLYLETHLKGNAAKLIANFKLTAENYDDAVRIVTNTYNRPELLRSRLWDKLVEMQASLASAISQRTTLCSVKAIWSQLKHLDEDSSSIGTIKLIRAKFPPRTREKVGELKKKGDSLWTVDELLNALDTVIDQLEVIEDANPTTDSLYNITSSVRLGSRSPSKLPGMHLIQHLLLGIAAAPGLGLLLGVTVTHAPLARSLHMSHDDLQNNIVLESLAVPSVYVEGICPKGVQKCRPLKNVGRSLSGLDFVGSV